MSDLEVESWVVVVTGITGPYRFANILGIYEKKHLAKNAAARFRRKTLHSIEKKIYKIQVHIRPFYGNED